MKNDITMHVSLYVQNIENTVNFYKNFFNQEAEKVKPGYAKFELSKPGLIISFVENKERVGTNFGHLGFRLESLEELNSHLEKAKAEKMDVLEEMGTNCCYATQDKFWVRDPDGYRWEVYYFHEDSEFNDPEYALESTEACCSPASISAPSGIKVKIEFGNSKIEKEEECCESGSCSC